MLNIKDIHIGSIIHKGVLENHIETTRICNHFNTSEKEIEAMYSAKSMDTEILLKWSKLLKYDFFRIYSQHLILYAPQGNTIATDTPPRNDTKLPQFRKNIYSKEVIDFILEKIRNDEMTKMEVINKYKIPKTTLYKWLKKY